MIRHHGLSDQLFSQVTAVLSKHSEVERAVLFGSRAKGTHRPGSDIDLALTGPRLDWRAVGSLYDELDDLLLPYRFSLIIFDANTDPDVAAHVARVGIPVFQQGQPAGQPPHPDVDPKPARA